MYHGRPLARSGLPSIRNCLTIRPPALVNPPSNSRPHPSTWTDAHVRDPSLLTQARRGYTYRQTVGCDSVHEAVGTGAHEHRSTGHAGGAHVRDPIENTQRGTLGQRNLVTQCGDQTAKESLLSPYNYACSCIHAISHSSSRTENVSYPCPSHPPIPVSSVLHPLLSPPRGARADLTRLPLTARIVRR